MSTILEKISKEAFNLIGNLERISETVELWLKTTEFKYNIDIIKRKDASLHSIYFSSHKKIELGKLYSFQKCKAQLVAKKENIQVKEGMFNYSIDINKMIAKTKKEFTLDITLKSLPMYVFVSIDYHWMILEYVIVLLALLLQRFPSPELSNIINNSPFGIKLSAESEMGNRCPHCYYSLRPGDFACPSCGKSLF